MNIKELPQRCMPREKLLEQGPASLVDAELLALLLRTGTAGRHVLVMAQEVLDQCGGLAGLLNADAQKLKRIKGLGGDAKRAVLLAVMELARRATSQQLQARTVMSQPETAAHYLQMHLGHMQQECFAALFMDTQLRLVHFEKMFYGTVDQTSVHPREVAARALAVGASHVLVAHNHPSGNVEPSQADIAITRHLQQALALLEITLVDHIIVAQGRSLSMVQRGVMA